MWSQVVFSSVQQTQLWTPTTCRATQSCNYIHLSNKNFSHTEETERKSCIRIIAATSTVKQRTDISLSTMLKNAVFWDVTHVALVRTYVSEEHSASIIRVTRIGELGTLAVTSNRRTLRRNTKYIFVAYHHRENFKSYIALTGWAPYRRRNVSPVKYELGFYIPEDNIVHTHCHENLESYKYFGVCTFTATVP
jgi:hypothetical protein